MKSDVFQRACEKSKFKILQKQPTEHGYILLAERLRTDPEYPNPFFETLWAIERDDCDVAQVVRNDTVAARNGLIRRITQDERIADAKKAALQYIKDNLEVGRYT